MVALDAKGRDPNYVIMLELRANGYVGMGESISKDCMLVKVEVYRQIV